MDKQLLTNHPRRGRRATESIGLVLFSTAALMLGMPGCEDHTGANDPPPTANTQPSAYRATSHGAPYHRSSGYSHRRSAGSSRKTSPGPSFHSSRTSRGGFGSTGHSVGS